MSNVEEQENTEPIKEGMSLNVKIILGCTIALIVFLSGAMFFMFSYLNELSDSPFVIGAQKTAQSSGADDVYCSCQLIGLANKDLYPFKDPTFSFNSSGMITQEEMLPDLSLQRYK